MALRRKHLLPLLALSASLTLALTGCSTITGLLGDLIEGKEDVFSLAVGDCFNDDTSEESTVSAVVKPKCSEEHDNEVYDLFQLDASDVPSYDADTIQAVADEGCFATFEDFVGVAVEDTALDLYHFTPTQQSWDNGDREVVCAVYSLDGPVTGSLEGRGAEFPL